MLILPKSDDRFTVSKAKEMGLDEAGLVGMINDLADSLKQKDIQLNYYKSLLQTVDGFGSDIVELGKSILDFTRANPLTGDGEKPITF